MFSLRMTKIKKTFFYSMIVLLMLGVSLITGLLSFGGMFALWPLLPVAIAGFVLSVAYEGEIYIQNITSAFNKLFKPKYSEYQFAEAYLDEQIQTLSKDSPQFFKDYAAQCARINPFEHGPLDNESLAIKESLDKTKRRMIKWFAKRFFGAALPAQPGHFGRQRRTPIKEIETYEQALECAIVNDRPVYLEKLKQQTRLFRIVQLSSIIASLVMGFGTTYLLAEAFAIIPFFVAIPVVVWPIIIVPMAAISGVAYGLLTYNAITDMIAHESLARFAKKLYQNLQAGVTPYTVFMVFLSGFLFTLAIGLTICTAGTWWTIIKNTPFIFGRLSRVFKQIMLVVTPLILAIGSLFFNLQNTAETVGVVHEAASKPEAFQFSFTKLWVDLQAGADALWARENILQLINIPRLILKLTITPLRILLFLGHLISIGVMTDRVPGIPEVVSALLGIISEGFEDAHYFVSGSNCSHDHSNDIPTRVLKFIFSPLYYLAALWDYGASQLNRDTTRPVINTFDEAWNKQFGLVRVTLSEDAPSPSVLWQKEQAIYLLDKQVDRLEQATYGVDVAKEKIEQLNALKTDIRQSSPSAIKNKLEKNHPNLKNNRMPMFFQNITETEQVLGKMKSEFDPNAMYRHDGVASRCAGC